MQLNRETKQLLIFKRVIDFSIRLPISRRNSLDEFMTNIIYYFVKR